MHSTLCTAQGCRGLGDIGVGATERTVRRRPQPLTALGTLHCAGAPVSSWDGYDTHYTERRPHLTSPPLTPHPHPATPRSRVCPPHNTHAHAHAHTHLTVGAAVAQPQLSSQCRRCNGVKGSRVQWAKGTRVLKGAMGEGYSGTQGCGLQGTGARQRSDSACFLVWHSLSLL